MNFKSAIKAVARWVDTPAAQHIYWGLQAAGPLALAAIAAREGVWQVASVFAVLALLVAAGGGPISWLQIVAPLARGARAVMVFVAPLVLGIAFNQDTTSEPFAGVLAAVVLCLVGTVLAGGVATNRVRRRDDERRQKTDEDISAALGRLEQVLATMVAADVDRHGVLTERIEDLSQQLAAAAGAQAHTSSHVGDVRPGSRRLALRLLHRIARKEQ